MSIYTKTGDKGTTSLGDGSRVSKASLRVEAYGTVDELCSHIGLLRAMQVGDHHEKILISIQEMLMTHAAEVSLCKGFHVASGNVKMLEQEIDALQKELPPLKYFLLPGGNMAAAQCHVARCVCRRAERLMVQVIEKEGNTPEVLVTALNRLSDYLFVLSRTICYSANIKETHWNTEKYKITKS